MFRARRPITYQVVHIEQELVIGLERLNSIPDDVDFDGQVLRDYLPSDQITEKTLQFFHTLRIQLVLS